MRRPSLAPLARTLTPTLAALALLACAPGDSTEPAVTPDGRVVSDMARLDAAGGAAADAAVPVGLTARYPWGPFFDPVAAADDCAQGAAPEPWWCGGREDSTAGGDAGLDDTWIAFRLTAAPCPTAGDWAIEQPYAGIDHPDLDRVCRYVWTSEAGPPALGLLPDGPELRLERDRQVVAAHAVPAEVWQPLEQAWRVQMNLPDWTTTPDAAPGAVRVAVLDASPDSSGGADGRPASGMASSHGLAIGNLLRAVACPAGRGDAGPCAADLAHHLTLPRIHGGASSERGGAFGSQGEFAEAVVAALGAWQDAGAQDPLILNLSLGWTAAHGGALDDASRFLPQLGLWALDMASCSGALAIAAAGNRARADAVGATYPAAWTAVPSLCDPTVPSVYAIGGVDGRDGPLGLSRPGSQPRLVAPAAHVMLGREGFEQPAGDVPLSGTSLAAAAASGAAALVWAWRPDLDPAGVMALLYDAAAPVEGFADVDLDGPVPRRRLDVCAALEAACVDGDCAEVAPACLGRPADARADHGALLALMYPDPALIDGPPMLPGDGVDVYDAPFATPQPTVPQCPYCGISGGLFYGQLTSDEEAELIAPVLHIDDGLGGVQIALPDLPTDTSFKLDLGYFGEVKGAWLVGQLWVAGKLVESASEIAIAE